MNNNTLTGDAYLEFLSNNVKEIRDKLGWNQLELCERLGVSRPTISGIENGSGKLSKTLAHSFYTCVFGEIAIRRIRLQKIDYEVWMNQKERNDFIKKINKIIWNDEKNAVNWGVIIGAAAMTPFVPSFTIPLVAVGAAVLFAFPKKAKYDSEIISDQVKSLTLHTVDIIEQELLVLFDLNTLNIAEYVGKLHGEAL